MRYTEAQNGTHTTQGKKNGTQWVCKVPRNYTRGGGGLCLENDMREIESYTEGLKNTQGYRKVHRGLRKVGTQEALKNTRGGKKGMFVNHYSCGHYLLYRTVWVKPERRKKDGRANNA